MANHTDYDWEENKKIHESKGRPIEIAMTPKEADCVESHLDKNDIVFEWGSGYSTILYSKFVEKYYSVENNQEWYSLILKEMNISNIENITLIYKPQHETRFDTKLDSAANVLLKEYTPYADTKNIHPTLGTLDEVEVIHGISYWCPRGYPGVDWHCFLEYINCIKEVGIENFNKIIVDGRNRIFCAYNALEFANKDTIVFFHDFFYKPWYHTVLKWYDHIETSDTLAVLRKK